MDEYSNFIVFALVSVIAETGAEQCYIKRGNNRETLYCNSESYYCCESEENRECCSINGDMGHILGAVAGGLAVLVVFTAILVCCCVKKKNKRVRRIAVQEPDRPDLFTYTRDSGHPSHDRHSLPNAEPRVQNQNRHQRHIGSNRVHHMDGPTLSPPPIYSNYNYQHEAFPDYAPPPYKL